MKSLEQRLLAPTDRLLDEAAAELLPGADATSARLTILEAVSSRTGGWSLDDYWTTMERDTSELRLEPIPWADKILASVQATTIPVALALSALSREVLPTNQQRKTGAYYTDWRLAQMLAADGRSIIKATATWEGVACSDLRFPQAALKRSSEGSEDITELVPLTSAE